MMTSFWPSGTLRVFSSFEESIPPTGIKTTWLFPWVITSELMGTETIFNGAWLDDVTNGMLVCVGLTSGTLVWVVTGLTHGMLVWLPDPMVVGKLL